MDIFSLLTGAGVGALLLAVLGFLLKGWLEARIRESIKHEYDVLLDGHRLSNEVRMRAALVAELMSEWIASDTGYKRLNELSFQAFLWLPQDLAQELSKTLSHKKNAKNLRQTITGVRKHLLGAGDSLNQLDVITFRMPKQG